MSKELIESIKSLGLKSKDIEAELKMPQNCLASMLTGKRAIPLKWQLALTAFVNIKNCKKQDLPISKQGKEEYDNRTNPLTNAARGRDESGVNEDELEFDFRGEKFLDIEKHTKYPKKDRPTNKGEAITWDNLKKESDQRIKEAWAKRKTVQ